MKRFFFFLFATALVACGKNDTNDDGSNGGGGSTVALSEADLSGPAGKQWFISELKIIYYSSSGNVDSTVNKGGGASEVTWFGTMSNGGQYYATAPLDVFLPGVGKWSLNMGQRLLTFTCSAVGCSSSETWQVEYSPRNAYGEAVYMTQQQSLSGGRKRILKARLFRQ